MQGGLWKRSFVLCSSDLKHSLVSGGYIGRKLLPKSRWEDKHMDRIIKRGEIYYAELNPVIGSEQGGTRPVLIISNNTGNRYSPTVIIAAITSRQTKSKLPTHYDLNGVSGLPADSIVLLEQIRTIDKKRLKERLARLDSLVMEAIATPLLISIGLQMGSIPPERSSV